MGTLADASRFVIQHSMGMQAGETVLVIVDTPKRPIGEALVLAARELGGEGILVEMTPRVANGTEPPKSIAAAMAAANIVLAPTSKSLTHTKARKEACEAGARIATMPNITAEIMVNTLQGDITPIVNSCLQYAGMLTGADTVRITSPGGTDLTLSLTGRSALPDLGVYHQPGQYGNLPAGEVYAAPLESTANGTLVIDGSMAGIGMVDEPIHMTVRNGLAVDIEGGAAARKLVEILEPYGQEARNIAEIGLGMNPYAVMQGVVLVDEKVLGTVHIALGNNITFGGQVGVPIHLDGLVLSPTVEVNGKIVIAEGKLCL